MKYSPVIIPTLNRKDHLKRCLESLANNTGAENTEVYISVDFPPSEKYIKGHQEVADYLAQFDDSRFKKLVVVYQRENLGPRENYIFLQKLVREVAESYIFSEDDNEFAPNFLEYINKGLALYKEDENVIAICGAKDTEWIHEKASVNFAKLLPAYGFGAWIDKEERLEEKVTALLMDKKTLSIKNMISLLKKNRAFFDMYICDILCTNKGLFWKDRELYLCDSVKGIYMHLTDAVCVVPVKAKSRTWGNDGTGVNMVNTEIDPEKKWPLDKDLTFEYGDTDCMRFNEKNYRLGNEYLKCADTNFKFLLAIFLYILLLICGKERKYLIRR